MGKLAWLKCAIMHLSQQDNDNEFSIPKITARIAISSGPPETDGFMLRSNTLLALCNLPALHFLCTIKRFIFSRRKLRNFLDSPSDKK
jgi:hypothetical protein